MKISKIVGLNSDFETAQVLITTSQGSQAIFLVNCSLEDAFTRARHALSEAENAFCFSSEPNLSTKVRDSFEAISEDLKDAESLSFMVLGVEENQNDKRLLYLQNRGQGLFCNLIRDGSEIDLTKISELGDLVSGLLEPGDRILMGTESLKQILKQDFGLLLKLPVDKFEDEVQSHLLGFQVLPLAAVMIEEETELEAQVVEEVKLAPHKPRFKFHFNFHPPKLITPGQIIKISQKIVPRSRRGLLALGVFLLVVVVLGTLLTLKNQKSLKSQTEFQSLFSEASDNFNQALSLKDLNSTEANSKLKLAKEKLTKALEINPKDGSARELEKKINENSDFIFKVYKISELPVWLDLNLIKKDFNTNRLSYSLGKILVMDPQKSSLVLIDTSNKSFQILGGGEKLDKSKSSSLNGNLAFVLTETGIVKIDSKSELSSLVVKTDSDWGVISEIIGFAGNIYLIDSGKNQIWKYLPVENGYSDKRSYLKDGTGADLQVKKTLIDSSIWLLKAHDLLKYTAGVKDYFAISGLDADLNDPVSFFISDETKNIYLLDSNNKRLVVVDKTGIYQAQYQSEELVGVDDLVVDEEKKSVYLLKKGKIYLLELK